MRVRITDFAETDLEQGCFVYPSCFISGGMDKSGNSCLQGDNFILDFCHILSGNFKIITDLQVHPELCSGVEVSS